MCPLVLHSISALGIVPGAETQEKDQGRDLGVPGEWSQSGEVCKSIGIAEDHEKEEAHLAWF